MQRHALRREQRAIQRILHQRVLERVVGGDLAALAIDAEDQAILLELRQQHRRIPFSSDTRCARLMGN